MFGSGPCGHFLNIETRARYCILSANWPGDPYVPAVSLLSQSQKVVYGMTWPGRF